MLGLRAGLEEVLVHIRKVPGVTAVGIVRRDGIVIDELLPKSADSQKVGAMAASIVGTSEMATDELAQGGFEESIVEAKAGRIVAIGAGPEAILVALVKPDANLGLILVKMREQADRVRVILGMLE